MSRDEFQMSVGLANDLQAAFRRNGWTEAEVKAICVGERLKKIRHLVTTRIVAEVLEKERVGPRYFIQHEIFTVTIDLSLSFDEMVSAGKYDVIGEGIDAKNCIDYSVTLDVPELLLLGFGSVVTPQELKKKLEQLELRQARVREFLAFGAQYPNRQRESYIIGPKADTVDSDGNPKFLCLNGMLNQRALEFYRGPSGELMRPDDRLLVARI